MNSEQLQKILEAALFACDEPVTVDALRALFSESEDRQATPSREEIRATLGALQESYADRGVELKEVASGYRFQINEQSGAWVKSTLGGALTPIFAGIVGDARDYRLSAARYSR